MSTVRQIKKKSFKLQKEAVAWAKKEKKAAGPNSGLKWETNRTTNPDMSWEAVLFKETE
jgi:hypothetical protein